MIVHFSEVQNSDTRFGGKAQTLGLLSQKNFRVPPGLIIDALPERDEEYETIFKWWKDLGSPKLAIRSSARGEDSAKFSFAGQNSTFLNVETQEGIKSAIKNCFDSIKKQSSQAYGEHFLGSGRDQAMNVVVQQMVDAKYSGVFFSRDPRGRSSSWLLEFIEGLGEDLVSGKVTPNLFTPENKELWESFFSDVHKVEEIVELGLNVKKAMSYEVDMEWSIDHSNTLYLLQARPITTLNDEETQDVEAFSQNELKRLKETFSINTVWDGQTFAEWTGYPTPLTFDLWRQAFSPKHAFGSALEKMGYLSFKEGSFAENDSILDHVFGQAYVNLNRLGDLFFGPIPYRIDPFPRPHLKFDFKKITLKTIFRTPYSVFKMLKVGWNLSTNRKKWLSLCRRELSTFKSKMQRPLDGNVYREWSDEAVLKRFHKEFQNFSTHALHWPFILIILTESTLNSLSAILKSFLGEAETEPTLKRWMGEGLKTTTTEMNRYFKKACAYPDKREFFMSRYGHRGPGELDLSHKRWIELQDKSFYALDAKEYEDYKLKISEKETPIVDEIEKLQTFKRSIIKEEWLLLKEMLELREQWKMEILKPYAHIRFLSLEIGKRLGIGDDIFWLKEEEIKELSSLRPESITKELSETLKKRKEEKELFKAFSLPQVVSLKEIENILLQKDDNSEFSSLKGEALSPGLVEGRVLVVEDIEEIDLDLVDENTILVAKATDPGWTPLFTKVKGIVVEKGGVLSHCAIVAREMHIPAVSGIYQCHKRLKNNQHIWVDGNHGRVSLQ